MTHRSEVEWLDIKLNIKNIFEQVKESAHSKFIVASGKLENIKGVITIKDFLENYTRNNFHLEDILQDPIYISLNTPSFKILNLFKQKKQYIGVVVDEFGSFRGIITLHDLIEAIVGDLPDEDETDVPLIAHRYDGSYLIDGRTLIFELNQFFQREVVVSNPSLYTTISGFILSQLQELPKEGDIINALGVRFEIVDMDGVRIDKILMKEVGQ